MKIVPNALGGDVATWAGVAASWASTFVALLSAGAVFYVGLQSHRLVKSQKKIADAARRREAFVVLRLMGPDVVAVLGLADSAAQLLYEIISEEQYRSNPAIRRLVKDELARMNFPVIDTLTDRIHVLEPTYAEAAAHAIASLRVLQVVSTNAAEATPTGDNDETLDRLCSTAFRLLRTEVRLLLHSVKLLQLAHPTSELISKVGGADTGR